jgi:hypothetical protein
MIIPGMLETQKLHQPSAVNNQFKLVPFAPEYRNEDIASSIGVRPAQWRPQRLLRRLMKKFMMDPQLNELRARYPRRMDPQLNELRARYPRRIISPTADDLSLWEDCENGRLIGPMIVVAGTAIHLEAIEVIVFNDGSMEVKNQQDELGVSLIEALEGKSTPLMRPLNFLAGDT